jgi:hypothetical protein
VFAQPIVDELVDSPCRFIWFMLRHGPEFSVKDFKLFFKMMAERRSMQWIAEARGHGGHWEDEHYPFGLLHAAVLTGDKRFVEAVLEDPSTPDIDTWLETKFEGHGQGHGLGHDEVSSYSAYSFYCL